MERILRMASAGRAAKRAKTIMIQGSMSSVGKSFITAGLCRCFAREGLRAAPFKSQNMSRFSFDAGAGALMSRSQATQAEAAGITPTVDMNPILLIPSSDDGSQVIVNGKPVGHMRAQEYFAYKKTLKSKVTAAFNRLAAAFDVIVIEGAGSPAEINLTADDIVNMGLAKMVDSPVLLVGDIDCGGVFAQIVGTLELLPDDDRARVAGVVINKFRGDIEILRPGIGMLEQRCGKKVVGVLPVIEAYIEEEDSHARDCREVIKHELKSSFYRNRQYDMIAEGIRNNLDMEYIERVMNGDFARSN